MHRNFFENARLWEGVLLKAGGFVFPLCIFEAVPEEHMATFSRLIESIGQQRDKVIEYQTRMTATPLSARRTAARAKCPKPCIWKGCCVSSA